MTSLRIKLLRVVFVYGSLHDEVSYYQGGFVVRSYFVCLLVILVLCSANVQASEQVEALEQVRDKALRLCIEEHLTTHTAGGLKELTGIKCHNLGIKSLVGIEQLIGLTHLSLYKNEITELPALLPEHLEVLNLAANHLKQASFKGLKKLKKLYLFRNQLTELSLENLTSLQELKANNNVLVTMEMMDVPELEKVYLFDNQLEDIALAPLSALTYMDVRHNPMPDELYDEMDELPGVTILHDGNADDW